MTSEDKGVHEKTAQKEPRSRGRLLLFSYAFPPMQTQMTPTVIKPMAALSRNGYEIDVLCASPFSQYLGKDESLLPYVEKHFRKIIRLQPPNGLLGRLRLGSKVLSTTPDLMAILNRKSFNMLMEMDLDQYEAIVTWSPFHSINPVMRKLKERRPNVRWIAQFSDPWAGNPLEQRLLTNIWSDWQEPRAVAAADFIVHSSSYSRELMFKKHVSEMCTKSDVIPHPFDDALFPQRPKARNERITLRYIGVLFGRRSPEPLFQALSQLLERRPDMRGILHVELVGHMPREMLETVAAQSLPDDMVTHVQNVSYVESLEKMYDADILVLIEADVRQNLFVPSKLSDYMGARTPIVGIAPPGGSEDVLKELQCWHARPIDIDGIANALEAAIDYVVAGSNGLWCNEKYRTSFCSERVAGRFIEILDRAKSV